MPQTLAQLIRAKHGSAYDDVSDIELEQAWTQKYGRAYDDVPRTEATLTRERQAPGTPSALESGHHPETLMKRTEMFGKRIPSLHEIGTDDLPSDAAFLKRGPEVGGAAGMMLGGPLGAGAGAALGSLVKGQHAQGAHVPTSGDVSDAALEGGTSLALSAIPGLSRVAAQFGGPALVNNARGVSKGLSALSGVGAGVASGSPITGLGAAAATKMLTSPGAVRAVGNAAARVGDVPMHAVNKAGFGLLNVKALLQALGEDPASTVP
jgi:hypothetical protein